MIVLGWLARRVAHGRDLAMSYPPTDDSEARDLEIGKILNDFLDQRARGEEVSKEELLAQHLDLADELREHLEMLRRIGPVADTRTAPPPGTPATPTLPAVPGDTVLEELGRGGTSS
jgi:hypothetical protein